MTDCTFDVTTLDLLKLYYHTGLVPAGVIEMRQAWFFNDLKPRTYYCLGGRDFFDGMYIQPVANWFVNMLPSTHPFTRFTVQRLGNLDYDDLLITYDYTSFTTSLDELKYFLFWLAESVGDLLVTVLDVFSGVREIPLRNILHAYNDAINKHQVFSVERFQEAEEAILLRQGRSGSLGVKGNIVFSTTLHGLALADITGRPDSDCCVGDDALAIVRSWFLTIFISCVNNLGVINPDKFTTISRLPNPMAGSILTEQYKFLKRPLNVSPEGAVNLGRLDFFPSVADALFPYGDGIHTTAPSASGYNAAKTFAMQVGRYFRIHVNGTDPSVYAMDDDLELCLILFRRVYRVYGLPVEGGIPHQFVVRWKHNEREADFFCPPVDSLEVFKFPWMGLLLDRFFGKEVTIPVTVGGTIPPPQDGCVGLTFNATSDVTVLQLGVDLGFLEKEQHIRYEIFDQSVSDSVWEKMERGGHMEDPLYARYTILSPLPSWWHDVTVQYYPQLLPEDPLDIAERLSSVLGDSVC